MIGPTREQVKAEFDRFIEFPEGSNGEYITTVSALLFAEHFAALAYAAGQASKVPEGWKLVPVEPTADMLNAGLGLPPDSSVTAEAFMGRRYRAMIAAAPSQEGEKCMTCGGQGMIGGFVSSESGYQSDPCPDCSIVQPDEPFDEAAEMRRAEWHAEMRADAFGEKGGL